MTSRFRIGACAALALACATPVARAQTGASDDRVSLPEGPGSLSGVGDDTAVNSNMGQMGYAVAIETPSGFTGMTPQLALEYSSASGNGVVGLGWSIAMPAIERLTLHGVPKYDADDELAADGGQLVLVGVNGAERSYRARFEGGFVRYTWKGAADGKAGYVVAEYPDGRVGYFGADHTGAPIAAARVGFVEDAAEHVFRWDLVEVVDVWGHVMKYDWRTSGTTSLLDGIRWVFDDGGTAEYAVAFAYESRDDQSTVCNGGFAETLDQRLSRVDVKAHGTVIRSYALHYGSDVASGGLSRLASVQLSGVGGVAWPVATTFGYSKTLGDVCTTDCDQPIVKVMNSSAAGNALGISFKNHDTQLIDMNGDALPDLVDSSVSGGKHRIFINTLQADGSHAFAAPFESTVGDQNSFDLSSAYVQVLDANGDGFADLLNASNGSILFNEGGGDWARKATVFAAGSGLPDLTNELDASTGALKTLRFLDYDNDHKIDLIRSSGVGAGNVTTVFRDTATGFVEDTGVDSLEVGFEDGRLELNDMNGDGLLDAMVVSNSNVRYDLNLGWGHWAGWQTAANVSFSDTEAVDAELEDMNGDGMADMVLVTASAVKLWLNESGTSLGDPRTITSADLASGSLPAKGVNDTVLFADMNGNGSSDVVWITSGGEVTYLDLFPVKPNLMATIDNGLGLVTTITYGTSVEHMAKDGGPSAWAHKVPFPNIVVDAVDTHDTIDDTHKVERFAYHDGFFDTKEKQFRGYARVEQGLDADPGHQEAGEARLVYDVGTTDPCMAGRLLSRENLSDGRSLQKTTDTYQACAVAEADPVDAAGVDVCYSCLAATEVELREGADPAAWVTTRTTMTYDGYGDVTRETQDGVVAIGKTVGDGACGPCARADGEYGAPCGATCTGDEKVVERDYIAPGAATGGKWILGKVSAQRSYSGDAGLADETRTYYDGDDFTGLALGQVERGFVSRVTTKDDAGAEVDASRAAHDADGNAIEQLDALGTPGGDGHRTTTTMSDDGLRVAAVDHHLSDADGAYTLHREYRYDALFDRPSLATHWQVVRSGSTATDTFATTYGYDAFGRLVSITQPGDDAGKPTTELTYEVGAPTRVVSKHRSQRGGAQDLEKVSCYDGKGRIYEEKVKTSAGSYRVPRYERFSPAGDERQRFQPFVTASGVCDDDPPAGTLAFDAELDAVGRPIAHTTPSDSGTVTSRITYTPTSSYEYDPSDDDPSDPAHDTPTIRTFDGLGRMVAIGRTPSPGAAPETYRFTYAELGGLRRITDPLGNARVQDYDRQGRVTRVVDPDRGTSTFTYDAVGDVTATTDPAGTQQKRYDGLGRLVAEWVDGAESTTKVEYLYDTAHGCPDDHCVATANLQTAVKYPTPFGAGTDWFAFDARLQPVRAIRQVDLATGPIRFDVATTYDNAGRVTSETYPGGITIDYTLDASGRVSAIPGYVDSVAVHDRGDVSQVAFGNGVKLAQTFDPRRALASIDVKGPSGTALLGYSYGRDVDGHIVDVTDRTASAGSPSGAATYTYDAYDRLIEAAMDVGQADEEIVTFGYDAADNLVSRESTLGAESPEHDGDRTIAGAHRVTQVGDLAIGYDAAGKVTSRGATGFDWDGQGRLVAVKEGGATIAEDVFAAGSDRVWSRSGDERTWSFGDFAVEDGVAVVHVKLGEESIARREVAAGTLVLPDQNADGALDAADAWLASRSSTAAVSAEVDAMLNASARQGLIDFGQATTWLHRDHTSDLALATDASGAPVERTLRYPFGALRWSSTNDPERRAFADQWTDEATGLVHFLARDYDPRLGRFLRPDEMFRTLDADQLDAPWEALGNYIYAFNSPIGVRDPTGANGNDVTLTWKTVNMPARAFSNHYGLGIIPALGENYEANQSVQQATGDPTIRTDAGIYRFVYEHKDAIFKILDKRISEIGSSPHSDPEAFDEAVKDFSDFKRALKRYVKPEGPSYVVPDRTESVAELSLDDLPDLPRERSDTFAKALEKMANANQLNLDSTAMAMAKDRGGDALQPRLPSKYGKAVQISASEDTGSDEITSVHHIVRLAKPKPTRTQRFKAAVKNLFKSRR
ncbi:MAG: toxin TcdB middle/N-terminal domain-containing protein [Myxococcota bacterium]